MWLTKDSLRHTVSFHSKQKGTKVVIAHFTERMSSESILLGAVCELYAPQHEWRGPIVVQDFLERDENAFFQIYQGVTQREPSSPDACIVWVPHTETDWATAWYADAQKEFPEAILVMCIWDPESPLPSYAEPWNHPKKGHVVFNVSYQRQWKNVCTPEFMDRLSQRQRGEIRLLGVPENPALEFFGFLSDMLR